MRLSEEESGTTTEESSESSSDSDEETIHDIPDKEFFKTLSCLKTKDPRIYDNNVQFFTEPPLIIKKSQNSITSEKQISNKEEITEFSKQSSLSTKNKFSLKDIDNDSSSEDEMSAFKKGTDEKLQVQNEVENDYIQFLKGRKSNIGDKEVETTLKPLHDYWNTQELDENEKFLKDYILNKKYLSSGADEKLGEENLSDDERELEEQAEYEANYNFRFENEENLKIKRFPRAIEGSLRKKNDSRKKKRAEIAQRKKEEKAKKHQDIKKKQKEKLSEIEGRLQKLKDLTGNVELGFKDDEILGDFDPEKHDQKMNELFNDDYYNKGDEEHHPVFDDDETYWDDNENINMDCDADISEGHKSKLTRAQKKKLRKKKTYQDVLDLAKPSFDPKVHNDFKKYIDEYYSMDCEDFIDDLPCKFKYREVVANDFGLSIEEILMADDSELNRWASLKKITRRCPNHVEKNEVSIYRAKSNDEYLKKKMLPSLYIDPEESNEQNEFNSQSNALNNNKKQANDIDSSKNKDPNNIVDEELQDQSMIDEELKNTVSDKSEQKKKKKKKHKKDNTANEIKKSVNEIGKELNIVNTEKDTSLKKEIPQAMGEGTNANTIIPKKKNRKKKKKKKQNTLSNSNNSSPNNKNQETVIKKPENNNQNKGQAKKKGKFSNRQRDSSQNNSGRIENKLKKKFKKKKEGVVNLSDSRLQAYGIKPKQFRSKIIYSQKSKT